MLPPAANFPNPGTPFSGVTSDEVVSYYRLKKGYQGAWLPLTPVQAKDKMAFTASFWLKIYHDKIDSREDRITRLFSIG